MLKQKSTMGLYLTTCSEVSTSLRGVLCDDKGVNTQTLSEQRLQDPYTLLKSHSKHVKTGKKSNH